MSAIINSGKMVEVAELPKFNIQFFADEDVPDVADEVEPEESDVQEPDVSDSDVVDQKPVQDAETNAKFAEMRRQTEHFEQRAKHADDLIARQYGESHGIFTVEQYEKALQDEQQEAERQQYLEKGIDPDDIGKIVDQRLESHPAVVEAKKQAADNKLLTNFNELQSEYKDLIKSPEDVPVEAWQRWDDGKTGLSLMEAYELTNRKAIREHLQASTKQSTLNKINGKDHIRGNGGEVSDDIDVTSIPPDTLTAYRQMFAKELRTGKMTDKDFINDYKKNAKGR